VVTKSSDMHRVLFLFALLCLLSPANAGSAGPLDGRWVDAEGNSLIISSGVLDASVRFESRTGDVRRLQARYVGYTTLNFHTSGYGLQSISMIDRRTLKVTGGQFHGVYFR
jgi:hypothetical protein